MGQGQVGMCLKGQIPLISMLRIQGHGIILYFFGTCFTFLLQKCAYKLEHFMYKIESSYSWLYSNLNY